MIQTLLPFNALAAITAAARSAALSFVAPGPAAAPHGADAAATADGRHDAAAPTLAERREEPGFALGWDHARHGLTPPLDLLPVGSPLRQGWLAAQAVAGQRTLPARPAQRLWLALRLRAWQQGQAFEAVQLTPGFLARLDTAQCPASRRPLRPLLASGPAPDAPGTPTGQGRISRLNPAAAYAGGNLAVLDAELAEARGTLEFDALWAQAQRLAAGECSALRGFDAATWLRLALLASFATPLPHGQAASLPLVVLPPNRVRLVNPVQGLQLMLTLQFTHGGYARRLLELSALMPGHETRQAFQIFMHTMLARRLAAGAGAGPADLRRALEDSWTDPLVQRRWQRLALRLTAADCERLLQRAAQRGLMVGGGRWLDAQAATEGWALRAGDDAQARSGMGACSARPGNARKRGSQKLAS
ncbi:hypothetical protein [Aquabacterium sp. OR-4]|uniref:hypothetical protein n=1 Tax=Aquabacterium sp. OR-4 TaxID=2978127 RepID=UPI0028C6DEB9|nr:hypothetical protein [Aquabacterium sp. OR-4]MDT7834921.1 hypothetical protein [Aquabacterium sp. OR-4]